MATEDAGKEAGKKKRLANLKPFTKDDPRRNKNGRPKRFTTILLSGDQREGRLTYDDVREVVERQMKLHESQLKEIVLSEESLAFEKVIAHAILKDIANGRLDSMEVLLSRLYGRPRENITLTQNKAVVKTYHLPNPDFETIVDAEVVVVPQLPQNGSNGNGKRT